MASRIPVLFTVWVVRCETFLWVDLSDDWKFSFAELNQGCYIADWEAAVAHPPIISSNTLSIQIGTLFTGFLMEMRRRWGYGKPLATHPNFCWGRAHLCFIAVPFYLGSVCGKIGRLGVKSFTRQRISPGRGGAKLYGSPPPTLLVSDGWKRAKDGGNREIP